MHHSLCEPDPLMPAGQGSSLKVLPSHSALPALRRRVLSDGDHIHGIHVCTSKQPDGASHADQTDGAHALVTIHGGRCAKVRPAQTVQRSALHWQPLFSDRQKSKQEQG